MNERMNVNETNRLNRYRRCRHRYVSQVSQATGCCCLFLFSELLPTIVGTSFPIRPHNTIGAQLRIVNRVSPHCKLYFFFPFFDLPSSRVIKVNAYTALDITLLLLNNISMFHSIYRYRGRGGREGVEGG